MLAARVKATTSGTHAAGRSLQTALVHHGGCALTELAKIKSTPTDAALADQIAAAMTTVRSPFNLDSGLAPPC